MSQGQMQYGTSNDAGTDITLLKSNNQIGTLVMDNDDGTALSAWSRNLNGIRGLTSSRSASGVYGENFSGAGFGVAGRSNTGAGQFPLPRPFGAAILGDNTAGGYAGMFFGDVDIQGYCSKKGGGFKIDHPGDPDNRYLVHSFVESPDMMNVYNGNVVTDASGNAAVELPPYFSDLNRDFRYQLTVIGEFAQAIIADEIIGNTFHIGTDKPNVKVSWQVTGIRKDAWANAHRPQAEIDKNDTDRGKYLSPEEHGLPATSWIFADLRAEPPDGTGDE
jgi:hypothetical protein